MLLADEDLFPAPMSFELISGPIEDLRSCLPGMHWCESLLIGDFQFDVSKAKHFALVSDHRPTMLKLTHSQASIFSSVIESRKSAIAQSFSTSMLKSLPSYKPEVKSMLQSYGITEEVSDEEAFTAVLRFATDICFHAPTMAFAQAWPGDTNLYFFNEPNPWEGPWKGEATHVLDVAYLFLNFNSQLKPTQREVAIAFAEDFVKFVAGKSPWPKFGPGRSSAKLYGGAPNPTNFTADMSQQETKRGTKIFEYGTKIGLDNIASAWNNFFLRK